MDESNNIKKVKSKEVSEIYKIFEEIYLKAPPVLKDLSNNSVDIDYKEFIQEQIDFKKIDTKFNNGEYCSITDAIKDIRTVFLNCYSFYGVRSDHTKKSLEIEELLEEKISCLDKNYKSLANVDLTFNLLNMESKHNSKLRYPKDCYDSVLLRSVAHCRPERLKKYHKILSTTLTTDEDNAHILEKILCWENEVYFNDIFHRYISSMWELPEIGNFVTIIFKKLDLDIINQGEIERMFLMPKESTTMGKIMTTLLMPIKKTKFVGQVMPYTIWSEKLSRKVSDWFKVYHSKNKNKVIVMNSLGIHPDFWTVMNEKNPLVEKDYSELSYFMKVWLLKGLCDYVSVKFKTINDIITNCNERQCTIWKNDLETEEYFFFDSMPDLRIYYYNIPFDEPSLEFLESKKTDKEMENIKANQPMNGFCSFKKEKNFKLIADSVEGLRTFLYKLDMEGTSVPEKLITALEDFLMKIESEEYNFIVLNNDSKIKLFKDCESYPDRIQKDKDNISFWERKDSKSIVQAPDEEIIVEKRQRKLIVQQDFETDDYYESDEYISENDKILSDFTDSEDEWGAINQPKNKVKQPLQTPTKLLELEKRLCVEGKMPKHNVKNIFDTSQSYEYYEHNKTLASSKNKNNLSLLEKKDSKPTIKAQSNEIILRKRTRQLATRQYFETDKYYESEEYFSENDVKSISDFTNSEDEWGAINQPKNKIKPLLQTPPKLAKLEKRLRVEDKVPKHTKIKVFDTNKKDNSIKSVELPKTQNNVKCNNNTNKIVYDHNKRVIDSKNIDNVFSNEEIVLIDSDKEENEKPPDSLKPVEIITVDEDMQNDCEILYNNLEISISTCTENKNNKTNKQDNYKPTESVVISVEDDDQIIISDDEDDVQFISMTVTHKSSPSKIKKPCNFKTNLNRSYNSVSANRKIIPTNYNKSQATSSIIQKLSQNVTIMPANVHLPKGIEVTMVKTPQKKIDSHFNSIKRRSIMSNGHLPNNSSMVNVKCQIISKPDLNGEVNFYVRLPNGKEHPGPNELINQYLKEHNNQLPDYWLVPLPVEVAKQYCIN
ncbi:uncharacterized protein LOC112598032 [Melanaphis sacchari]|uniref:Uncharacterized protein KIAA2026 n=1 Tax=Melanaphis sacchari TaxID=742174 RepID=A0A2H8TF90_9HEMI|nr:uncharacterized protein LOC112598032 [Melanaphis sacchari]XP_025200123.1 uncharacterized protein LOC112598032 [Melanaphis sacchari]XP_025200125.1 uncharacterized protein LOC112598032 [Melanaphis sacchari]